MRGIPFLKKVLYSTWFLAGLPAILLIFLIPSVGSKYRIDIEEGPDNYGQLVYSDLNADSVSELIVTGKTNPYFYITVRNLDLRIYDQWNIKDSLASSISDMFFGDFDHDRYSEIYIFSYRGDSLFLNVNEILQSNGTRMDRIFMDRVGYSNGEIAAVVKPAGFFDTDKDGFDELFFSVSSYYQLGPRRLYKFDLARKTIKSSQRYGSICLNPNMKDIDGDQRPEIFGMFSASGNYNRNVPYSDSSTWFMVFDDRLSFEFPPVEFPGFANALYTLPYMNDGFRGYVLFILANGANSKSRKSNILIYSKEGKLVRNRQIDRSIMMSNDMLFVSNTSVGDRIYLLSDEFLELNDRLEIVRSVALPFRTRITSYQADVDGDGKDEFLLYSGNERKVAIYSSDLRKMTEFAFSTEENPWKIGSLLDREHKYKLFIAAGHKGYFLVLRKNSLFILKKLLYPGIYFSLFFFIVLIKRIGTTQQKAKEDLNNRLITLQLQGIKAQLDPHFTFNTLNSIASLIYLEDRHAAYDYMRKFTQLLRTMLNDAEKIYRNLGDEIDFVTTYLELEKLRFGDKFNYEIEIGEGVSQLEQVPKLVLQTFVENAVKHGIMPSESGGVIRISALKEKDYLKLTIEDNGIGRELSAGHSSSTGKGLKLTKEFYEILNHMNRKPIKHLITDLYNSNNEPSGTRVEVWVPIEDITFLRNK
jgi:two-component sensor histidine kinase